MKPEDLQYILSMAGALPLLPVMAWQGKQVKSSVPKLAAAKGFSGLSPGALGKLRLLVLGESTMAGLGVEWHQDGFAGGLAEQVAQIYGQEVHWEVVAKSGYTVREVNDRLLPGLPKGTFELIVIGLGGNDIFEFTPPWQWRAGCRQLIQGLRQHSPEAFIVFIQMPPVRFFPAFPRLIKWYAGLQADRLSTALQRTVKGWQRVFFISEPITLQAWSARYGLEGGTSRFFSDGVHPSALTYRLWAKDTAAFLQGKLPPPAQ
ncbi:SGNH/GDSL hydrolase family protein [Phaeodactylibacter luteus]|uniref:SGNH/GDSL hydrolase family protein n=1 Tax=Phaeodactylibacter luteus TaxID=1564516 RepID=A0A5C6RKZ6_9BACT|nr:SGNH/GDSL hydrolase family protein [Phaeodactylibacter luteus]TXB62624.1 SGNH/GDSL hydrolase family protein [Phaeodactylibacter luteus]